MAIEHIICGLIKNMDTSKEMVKFIVIHYLNNYFLSGGPMGPFMRRVLMLLCNKDKGRAEGVALA
jgi:hypothetical protein